MKLSLRTALPALLVLTIAGLTGLPRRSAR